MTTPRYFIAAVLLGGIIFSGCVESAVEPSGVGSDLEKSKELWRSKKISAYTLSYHRICECTDEAAAEVEVTVRDTAVENVRFSSASSRIVTEQEYVMYYTVEDLFAIIEEAYATGAADVAVKYDARFGFPYDIYIDRDSKIADEELILKVTKFELL